MELKIYFGILARRWWLILAVTIAVGLATLLYAFNRSQVYHGSISYILRPHSALLVDDSTVRAIDTLSRRIEIATTYAEVAGSDLIKNRALARSDLTSDDNTRLAVIGRVIPGTNVLELSIRGSNREALRLFADAVSLEFIEYVNGLYDVFELELLDPPKVARSPAGPDKKIIVAGGIVLGIILGSASALLAEYWQIVTTERKHFEILDPETGTFNRAYLMLRLNEEASRARHNNESFALTLLALDYPPAAEAWTEQHKADMMRRVIAFIGAQLRDEDILCRYEATKFALLFPSLSVGKARDLLTGVEDRFGAEAPGLANEDYEELTISAGIAYFTNQDSVDEIISQAEQALETASGSEEIRIALFNGSREVLAAGV
jgi:diguanylate cyclase (GGDEF)-like protein